MDEMDDVTMDFIITQIGSLGVAGEDGSNSESSVACKAAINILFAISEAGAKTKDEAMDLLYDYKGLSKQYAALYKRHSIETHPKHKDGVWHCPDCNRRVQPHHSFCHRCGKRLGWG